jgi:hypothetical protein
MFGYHKGDQGVSPGNSPGKRRGELKGEVRGDGEMGCVEDMGCTVIRFGMLDDWDKDLHK